MGAVKADWDVVVIGGGNAALVAAISALEQGCAVLLLEKASLSLRGGNTRHTRNIRCVHHHADSRANGAYDLEEFWADLCSVGDGPSDMSLATLTVEESESVPAWMSSHGARWQKPLRGTLHLSRTNYFFLGGGKALLNTYYRTFLDMGGEVRYDAAVTDLVFSGDRCAAVVTAEGKVAAGAVVCASGGYEANLDWLRRYWGEAANNYVIRGPATNDGAVLQVLYDNGASAAGQEKGFHAVAVDARSPRYDGGIATRIDSIPFGIVVNQEGLRFYDEGEDIWPKRYASWGRLIAEQPGQICYSIWDARANELFLPTMYPPEEAATVEQLAERLGLEPEVLADTVSEYNQAVIPGRAFDPSKLDCCSTVGLRPPKSHWAQPIDQPPFRGIALRPGITFTYQGVGVTSDARIQRGSHGPFENVFAAGEIMSGNILSSGYLAGFGLTIGTVWGRVAGREAGRVGR